MSHLLCHVLQDEPLYRQMLEFRLNDDTGELCDSAAIDPPSACGRLRKVELDPGSLTSRFLFIPAAPYGLVFDTCTHVFYEPVRGHIYARRVSIKHHVVCSWGAIGISQIG